MSEHDDIGEVLLRLQHLHSDGGARHLHQAEDTFLHPRAAGGREQDRADVSVSTARSAAAMMALPTYMPIDPAMKEKFCATATMGVLRPISPSATSIASRSPLEFFVRASLIRSGYFFWYRGTCSGSTIGVGHLHFRKDAAVEQRLRTGRVG